MRGKPSMKNKVLAEFNAILKQVIDGSTIDNAVTKQGLTRGLFYKHLSQEQKAKIKAASLSNTARINDLSLDILDTLLNL